MSRFTKVTLRTAQDAPLFDTPGLVALLVPILRRQFTRAGFEIPIFTFLPDTVIMVLERCEDTARFDVPLAVFRRESVSWMIRRRLSSGWDGDIGIEPLTEGEVAPAIRSVLEAAHRRNLASDPYLYPYTGSTGTPIWETLGDPIPDRLLGYHA